MSTVKQILASIDNRLAGILAAVSKPEEGSSMSTGSSTRFMGLPTKAAAASGTDVLLSTFVASNWNGAAASPVSRGYGYVFKNGDVPSGSTVVLTDSADVDVPAQIAHRVTYVNGSLKRCTIFPRDTTIAAAAARTYKIKKRPSSTYADTGNGKTLADVLAVCDPQVAFTSVTHSDNTATVTHGSGSMLGKLSDANIAGRTRVMVDGPVMKRFYTWSMVKDGTTGAGAADPHLKIYWYVDVWVDAANAINKVAVTPVVALDWWSVATKYRLNYTAEFKNGATSLQTYATVQHPYHSTWACVKTADDNSCGKPHVLVGTLDTIAYGLDKVYWSAATCFPPFDYTLAANQVAVDAAYVPCGGIAHRVDIGGGGDYNGRGNFSLMDVHAFMNQSAASWRIARVNALVGLHHPTHYRLGNGATDTIPTIPTLIMDRAGVAGATTTWVADGMPVAKHLSVDSRSDPGFGFDDFAVPTGGQGVWTTEAGSAHASNFSGFMALAEGEDYLFQAALDIAMDANISILANTFGTHTALAFHRTVPYYRTQYLIPDAQWSSIPELGGMPQERGVGWAMNLLAMLAFVPNAHPEKNFCNAWIAHCGDFLNTSMTYLPQAHKDLGLWLFNDPNHARYMCVHATWMHDFIGLGGGFAAMATENAGINAWMDMIGNHVVNVFNGNPYKSGKYRSAVVKKSISFDETTNPYVSAAVGALVSVNGASIDLTTDVVTMSRDYGGANANQLRVSNDDIFYPAEFQGWEDNPDTTLIAPLVAGTAYYAYDVVIGATTITLKLSTAPGGAAPVNFTETGAQHFWVDLRGNDTTQLPAGTSPDYADIALAALIVQNKRGHVGATNALVAASETWLALRTFAGDARFKMKRAA